MSQPILPLYPVPGEGSAPESTETAQGIARGVSRLLMDMGYAPLMEFKLGNGLRVDLAALNQRGMMIAVEIKTSAIDLKRDLKWFEYLGYCDSFYFAVPPAFPREMLEAPDYLPQRTGLILADRFQAAILRGAEEVRMSTTRRRAETLRFARKAARRLALSLDPMP